MNHLSIFSLIQQKKHFTFSSELISEKDVLLQVFNTQGIQVYEEQIKTVNGTLFEPQ